MICTICNQEITSLGCYCNRGDTAVHPTKESGEPEHMNGNYELMTLIRIAKALETIADCVTKATTPQEANVVQDDGEVKFCSCTMNPEDKEKENPAPRR